MSKRWSARLASAVAAAVVWAGAHADRGAAQEPVALAADAARTIRVTGWGEVEARPDQARIRLAVESFAATAREAGQENARAMQRVIEALTAAGVPRGSIETRGYSVYPEYAHEEGKREPRLRGYRATNRVMVETEQLDRVGEVIDVALAAGANRLEEVGFQLTDADAAREEALRAAVQRARASAESIASALGVRLGRVLDASTSAEPYRPLVAQETVRMRTGAVADAPPTPIEPAEQTVRAHVTLVFAIEEG